MNRPAPPAKGSAIAIPLALTLTLLAISSGWWGKYWWKPMPPEVTGAVRSR